ncbi:thioredoxin family protein [Desulfitibacter alkalitolerans]|uniref:thioredoxin family protein n=1 Tax=Desulfitibacter alkalitolerans TaxID=264641 RepID=UPI0006884B35|nr:thioredoxin family protein [Desulfitibacter alkalitolerans]
MKKASIIFLILLLIILLSLVIYGFIKYNKIIENFSITNYGNEEEIDKVTLYEIYVRDFEVVDINSIYTKMRNNEIFYLYVGRITCPWCVKFVPILHEFSEANGITILYLDSTDTETNLKLKNFRECYNIDTVPALLIYDKNQKLNKVNLNSLNEHFNVETLTEIINSIIINKD